MTTSLQKAPPPGEGPATDEPDVETATAARPRRKRLLLWDRVKFLVLIGVLFAFTVSADMSSNPILGWTDSVRRQASSAWWLLALGALELVRQIHMVIGEHSSGYYVFWTDTVFGRAESRVSRTNDWNRFRMARTMKWVIGLVIIAFIYAKVKHESVFKAISSAPGDIWHAAPLVVQIMLIMLLGVGQFAAIFWFMSKGGVDVYFPDDVKTRFSDIWGQDHVLDRVKENVFYLEKPEEIEERGGYVPGGILLWGPPGTGKTLIAEAVAGETGRPFVFVDPGAFTAMFFGVGILKVKSLFRKLRKLSLRYGGVIVFFDEADTLGSRGQAVSGVQPAHPFAATPENGPWAHTHSCNGLAYASAGARQTLATPPQFVMPNGGGGQSSFDGTLQALLTEMSGLKKPRGFLNRVVRRSLGMRPKPPPKYRILVMMATNMPQSLDAALLRPGRIDRLYKVGYPTKGGRIRTYEGYLNKVNHELTDEQIDKLAVISPQATGASIKDIVNEALVIATRDGRDTITWPDLTRAKALKEHGLPDGHTYPTRERHSLALHEACHAVAMYRLMKDKVIEIATIERRGDVGGFVAPVPLEDRFVQWRSEIENDVMTFLASLVGERMFFEGDNTQGVGGDMRAATALIMQSFASHAMGTTLASRTVTLAPLATPVQDGADRAMLDGPFGRQIEEKLQELFNRTEVLLDENRREVLAVTHALETYLTISGEDVEAIIEGTQGPTVDGRQYTESTFAELAEEYHRDTVRAIHDVPGALVLAPLPGRDRAAAVPTASDARTVEAGAGESGA